MSTTVICTRNYIDSTYLPVYIIGGAWDMPLSNLQTDDLTTEVARSTGLTTGNTQFEVAFRELKEVTVSALPLHNLKRAGQYRVRYSDTPVWENATTGASRTAGNTTFTIQAGATSLGLVSGQYIKFEGHDTAYKITTTVTVAASGTATVTLSSALTSALTSGEDVECLSGDYTTPIYDSGWTDAIPTVYASLYPYWGHPSFWDGKPTEEEIAREKYPIVIVHDSYKLIKFQKWEFDDTTNADGYIELPRLYVAYGKQPTFNCIWGSTHSLRTDTSYKKTLNAKKIYDQRPTERTMNLIFPDLPSDEVYSNFFDDLRSQGRHGQMYVIFDPADTAHLHRRSMLATVEELPTISYDYHGGISGETYTAVSLTFQFAEVVA